MIRRKDLLLLVPLLVICAAVWTFVVSLGTVSKPSKILFVGDFEQGSFLGWVVNEEEEGFGIVTDPVRGGRFAMTTTISRIPIVDTYRKEITGPIGVGTKPGGEYWYGFSLFLPSPYPPDPVWEILAQWHGIPDLEIGEHYRVPPLALGSQDGKWMLWRNWDSKRNSFRDGKAEIEGSEVHELGICEDGCWTDWVVHVRWSHKSDGLLQVWKNGDLVVDVVGPTSYNDALGPFLKMGLYKGWKGSDIQDGSVARRRIFLDEFRMAEEGASYDDVAPASQQ